jgi:hypothetical protein
MTRLLPLCLLVLAAVFFPPVSGWYPDVAWLHSGLFSAVWAGAVASAGLAAVLLSGRLHPRDPALVAWAALGAAGCLLLTPLLLAKAAQESVDARRDAALTAARAELDLRSRRQAQEQATAARAEAAANPAPRDRFSQYEGRMDPDSLAAIRALDARMQAEVKRRADTYREALDANPTLGPSAWLTFRSREQVEQEREAFRRIYQATRTFTQFIQSFEETYRAEIEALELRPPADRVAIAEMTRVLQFWESEQTYELRLLDEELITAALNALDVLHDAWGDWRYSPRDEALEFDSPAAEAAFIQAMQRFTQTAKAAAELRRESTPARPGNP